MNNYEEYETDGYILLAGAIFQKARKDFRRAYRLCAENPRSKKPNQTLSEIYRFYHSEWAVSLSFGHNVEAFEALLNLCKSKYGVIPETFFKKCIDK